MNGLSPGTLVAGRYEVVRELGRGAMATVHLARDLKFGADIALKVARPSAAGVDPEFKARFVREARLGYLLGREPGFVRAYDWGELPGGTLFLACDLVPEAVQLDLRAGLRPVADRVAVFARAAGLVARAHARGVIHRDVKPQNLLVSAEGLVFLTDFGLAKVLGDRQDEAEVVGHSLRTGRDACIGTAQFMPPEQFENPAEVDARSDVFALGTMLFHALTGRFPFQGRTGMELVVQQVAVRAGDEPAPRPRDVDPRIDADLDAACAAAIAVDPDARPPSVEALLARLGVAPVERVPPPFLAAMRRGRATTPAPVALPAADDAGFTPAAALRALLRDGGPAALRAALGQAAALRVADERRFRGATPYLGRVALLPAAGDVVIGRSAERADVVLDLPTISTEQVRLEGRDGAWQARDEGSRNGTELDGARLGPEPRPLRDGSALCLSRHVTFEFHGPGSLAAWLEGHP